MWFAWRATVCPIEAVGFVCMRAIDASFIASAATKNLESTEHSQAVVCEPFDSLELLVRISGLVNYLKDTQPAVCLVLHGRRVVRVQPPCLLQTLVGLGCSQAHFNTLSRRCRRRRHDLSLLVPYQPRP
eukprot:gnl/Spiro4/9246_TR4873_c0_g1_i1.p1 gnl/Spiro4/9246_TR4873_c0_g1~~gnl/Spiro4/9246_TR4873_c0_g1_i1.p1  ORF type:complete len:129 (+),score=6.65 gnl/Spiro4/9246_TR4873_c0_g1_i1:373-759(+)